MPTAKKAVIYCRVSTKEQVEEGNSLSTQEKTCREYALKNGYEIAEVFIEQGESAKTIHRTELRKLLEFCSHKKNNISAVIAYKIDRISRNTDDYSQIRILLKRYKIEIKSTSEFFENTPAGRFMENIISNVAQFDNDVRTERCVGGMKEAMREGRYVWRAPIGYDNCKVAGKSSIAPNLFAPIIRNAFHEVAKNEYSIEKIRRESMSAGLRTKKEKPVSKANFYKLLRNKVYAGLIIKFGEQHKGTFEPIVSLEVFEQVQRVFKYRNGQKVFNSGKYEDFPLRRFFYHSSGLLLSGCWAKGRIKKYPYYLYHKRKGNYRKEIPEDFFKSYLKSFKLTPLQFLKFKAGLRKHLLNATEHQTMLNNQLTQDIQTLKGKQTQLINKNIEGVISNEILQRELEIIDKNIMHKTSSMMKTIDIDTNYIKLLEDAKDYVINPEKIWEDASFADKTELQWFYFPEGICFEGNNCRTTDICNLFKAKPRFSSTLSPKVNLSFPKSNTPKIANEKRVYPSTRKIYHNPHPVHQKEYFTDSYLNAMLNDLLHIQAIKEGRLIKEKDVLTYINDEFLERLSLPDLPTETETA